MPDPRRYRRRGPVFIECIDRLWLDPLALLRGQLTPARLPLARAYAPPAAAPVELEPIALACLAAITEGRAAELPGSLRSLPGVEAAIEHLMTQGLIEAVDGAAPDEVAALDDTAFHEWNLPAAAYHFASRWSGVVARDEVPVDAAGAARALQASRAEFAQQAQARGAPPTHRPARGAVEDAIDLPLPRLEPLDDLLAARETHRLFDQRRALTREQLAQVLRRAFAALGTADLGGGLLALRKHAPSGGGLHPVEAYPLVVDVDGLAPGWYHYRACDHQLAPVRAMPRDAARREIGRHAAGQDYFCSAPLVIALTLRFPRHHWKYPRHARAYRVMLMEAGHVGQTFYLAATAAGLGAFFTAAINDADIDATLGLDGIEEGCIALLGCGWPAPDGGAMRLSHYVAGA